MSTDTRLLKSAKLKLAILQAVIDLIDKRSYKELHIKEVCDRVRVSKVTLFKYFPQKEDILQYHMRVWAFHRAVELHQKSKKGIEGILYIVDKLAESYERRPGLTLGFIGQLANSSVFPKPFPVKLEERQLLYPKMDDIEEIKIQSLEQLLETYILDSIFHSEITKSSNTTDLTNLLISIIYGTVVSAHIHRIDSPRLYFRRNVEMVLNGLK